MKNLSGKKNVLKVEIKQIFCKKYLSKIPTAFYTIFFSVVLLRFTTQHVLH